MQNQNNNQAKNVESYLVDTEVVDAIASDHRLVHINQEWHTWNGKNYTLGAEDVQQAIRDLIPKLNQYRNYRQYLSEYKIEAVKRLCIKEGIGKKLKSDFAHKNILYTQNGRLDLNTLDFRPTKRSDLTLKSMPIKYDPSAKCPLWHSVLDKFLPDKDIQAFLQEFLGYTLIGDPSEEVMLIAYGDGANGKSTIFNAIQRMFGEYAYSGSSDTFTSREINAGTLSSMSNLDGIRYSLIKEGDGSCLNVEVFKRLTSNDVIEAKRMHKDKYTFVPTHVNVMVTNHKPRTNRMDHGTWRRILLLPFTVTVLNKDKDTSITDKLDSELSGIFNWCLAGIKLYRKNRLKVIPQVMLDTTNDYESESNPVKQFIEETYDIDVTYKEQIKSNILYAAYSAWSKSQSIDPLSQKQFSPLVEKLGMVKKRTDTGVVWIGLKSNTSESKNILSIDSDDLF